jgi:hypothetical protein
VAEGIVRLAARIAGRSFASLRNHCDWFAKGLARSLFADGKLTVSGVWALVVVLWVPLMLLPIHAPVGGVLRGDWTDHYHHNYAAWSFLRRGLSIYRLPLGAWRSGYPFQYLVHWPEHPFEYPPGCLVLFLPSAIWGRLIPMTYNTLGASLVIYLLALSQLSFFAVMMLLRDCAPGGRTMIAIYSWVLLTHIALTGFYDATWIGFAALMLLRIKQGRVVSACYWFAAASFISYRAAVLIPFLLMALWRIYRERPKGYKAAFGVLALVGCVDVWVFLAILRATKAISHTKDYLNITFVQMQMDNPRFVLAILAMVVGVVIALIVRSWATAITLVVATYLLHLNGGHFWRMSLLLSYPLAAAAFANHPLNSVFRSTSVAICVVMGAAFTMVTPGDPSTIVTDLMLSLPPRWMLTRAILGGICLALGILFTSVSWRQRRQATESVPRPLATDEPNPGAA